MSTEERQNLKFIKIQHGALMDLGIDIGTIPGQPIFASIWKFILNCTIAIFMQYGFFNHVVKNVANIDTVTTELYMFNEGILLAIKVIVFIIKANALRKLIWKINSLAEKANSAERDEWLAQNHRGELITKCYYYSCWACVIMSSTVPLIVTAYGYLKGQGFHLNMPSKVTLPFGDTSVYFSIILYFLNFFDNRALLNMSVGIDTLFGWLIYAVSGHFSILRIKIEETSRKIILDNNHDEFVKDVGSFVRYHNKTLKILKDFNLLFGEILWAEITLSCLQMCFMLYSLTNMENVNKAQFDLIACMAITMQMMIFCFGGEKIKSENDMLCDDIYKKMPWEKMYSSERKLMLLPLIRAQREASLIGIFFNLNRNLLVYIFQTSFSFIALLRAMRE